jgi:8-oxo-dGTP pyrophosphatase MutT (NUDIX family)
MNNYVLGFAFDEARENVTLISKRRPTWQAGLFNGVGGKIEPNEIGKPRLAMTREFQEETGVVIPEEDWQLVARLVGADFVVYTYTTFTDAILEASTQTDEAIWVMPVSELWQREASMLTNVSWLVHMCLDRDMLRFTPVTVAYN